MPDDLTRLMWVDLTKVGDNHCRDFAVDPIDDAIVEELCRSIDEHGLWPGMVLYAYNGSLDDIRIAAGHHRVRAAVRRGYTKVQFPVRLSITDEELIRLYAEENATQRGNYGTAQAGSIASTVHFLAKAVMVGNLVEISTRFDMPTRAIETLRGQIASERGLGRKLILNFLHDVPGINQQAVNEQIINLKSSGNYARIIGEVEAEIVREEQEAAEALERAEAERVAAVERARLAKERAEREAAEKAEREAAEKARALEELQANREEASNLAAKAAAAAEQEVTFDYAGVVKHLTVAHHINTFRDAVTELKGVKLPVEKQAELAACLVAYAKESDREFTGSFIKLYIHVKAEEVLTGVRRDDDEARRSRLEQDILLQMQDYQKKFSTHVQRMTGVGVKIRNWLRDYPTVDLTVEAEFRNAVTDARKIINALEREFGHGERTETGTGKAVARRNSTQATRPNGRPALGD
jgi:hypothetical protein